MGLKQMEDCAIINGVHEPKINFPKRVCRSGQKEVFMISVIDRTLSTVNVNGDTEAVRAFISELFSAGVNVVELSEELYLRLDRKLPPRGKYILRLGKSADAEKYPEIHRFVAGGAAIGNVMVSEEYFIREGDALLSGGAVPLLRPIRLCLMAENSILDPQPLFAILRETFIGHIEFSPRGETGVTTMLAAEWILGDGSCVVVSLDGVGGYASLEDLLGFLCAVRRRRPVADRAAFDRLRELYGKITEDRPQTGESRFLLGMSSSCQAVKFRLERLGYTVSAERLKALTLLVRAEARRLERPLGDEDIRAICRDSL